jgi:signal transduction histidine kinase
MNEVVSAAVHAVKRSLESDGISIIQKTRPVPAILAKPEEIQQVIFNIVRNGVQACGQAGSIEIETSVKDHYVSVRISDTGHGIKAVNLKKIFDPFFTTKGPDDGEGLGLYIVHQIVLKYEGTIDLVSDGGTGTTFLVRFPAAGQKL